MELSQASVFVTHICTCKWQSSHFFISLSSLKLISILNGFLLKHRWEISDSFPSSNHSNARKKRKAPCSSLMFSRHPRIKLQRLSFLFGKSTLFLSGNRGEGFPWLPFFYFLRNWRVLLAIFSLWLSITNAHDSTLKEVLNEQKKNKPKKTRKETTHCSKPPAVVQGTVQHMCATWHCECAS